MEILWESNQESGNPDVGNAQAGELAAGWSGEAGKFCQALLECGGGKAGFIEEVPGLKGI